MTGLGSRYLADDEVSFSEIWQAMLAGWRWLISGALAGPIVVGGYFAFIPPQYEATGLIEIGRIASYEAGSVLVESPTRVVTRINFPAFAEGVVRRLGWDGQRGGLVHASIKAALAPNSDLVVVKVRGLTRDDASTALAATIAPVVEIHRAMVERRIQEQRAELAVIEKEIAESQTLAASNKVRQATVLSDHFRDQLTIGKLEFGLRERGARLRASINGNSVTGLINAAWVPDQPVFPQRKRPMLLASIGGALLGFIAYFLHRTLRGRVRRGEGA